MREEIRTGGSAPDPARAAIAPGGIRKRSEFLRIAKGRRYFTPAFALQAALRPPQESPAPARFGLTITKKTGNAVERNRMRRRLRDALKRGAAMDAKPGCDYVIVAQREVLSRPFAALIGDIERAVAEVGVKLDNPGPPRRPKPGHDTAARRKPGAPKQSGTGSGQ